ncbi:hypothetical protein SISSUDRAFT_993284, partial [Sistotremastrum suecicum HHB10207 ss-3]
GGARFPYPKQVWSPSGGWWTRPSNWKANTLFVGVGIAAATYATFRLSASHEVRTLIVLLVPPNIPDLAILTLSRKQWRYVEPIKPIPSMAVSPFRFLTGCDDNPCSSGRNSTQRRSKKTVDHSTEI